MQYIEIWENEVLPLMIKVSNNAGFDPTLEDTLKVAIHKTESKLYTEDFTNILQPIVNVITSQNYLNKALIENTKENYDNIVRLGEELSKFIKIFIYEKNNSGDDSAEEVDGEKPAKDRLPNTQESIDKYASNYTTKERLF